MTRWEESRPRARRLAMGKARIMASTVSVTLYLRRASASRERLPKNCSTVMSMDSVALKQSRDSDASLDHAHADCNDPSGQEVHQGAHGVRLDPAKRVEADPLGDVRR